MSISMYHASVPVFTRMLGNLSKIVTLAAEHAEAKKINPSVLINSRLFPDMLPFSSQIQIASDSVKGCVARLAGVEPPSFPDTETTFEELQTRIQKTLDYIATFTPEQIDGSEEREIKLVMRSRTREFVGLPYLIHYNLPNVYFHITTAYNILRKDGVALGKMDYLGRD